MAGPLKCAAALLALSTAAVAGSTPVLTGIYHVGDLGLVDFSMAEGKVTGKYKATGSCGLTRDMPVVTGAFEGNIFVGTVDLCQEPIEGQRCAESRRRYPLLAVWHADEMLGVVHLEQGCVSPALDRGQLLFRQASMAEKLGLDAPDASASALAKNTLKDPEQLMQELIKSGEGLLARHDYPGAEDVFREALTHRSDYFPALAGLGAAQVKQHKSAQALEMLGKAAVLAQQAQAWSFLAQIQLNIGTAQLQQGRRRDALAALASAVKLDGAAIYDDLLTDADLAPLKGDADFKRLVEQARGAKEKAKKR